MLSNLTQLRSRRDRCDDGIHQLRSSKRREQSKHVIRWLCMLDETIEKMKIGKNKQFIISLLLMMMIIVIIITIITITIITVSSE